MGKKKRKAKKLILTIGAITLIVLTGFIIHTYTYCSSINCGLEGMKLLVYLGLAVLTIPLCMIALYITDKFNKK